MTSIMCRNRGTEYIKSPEMLKCALADNKGRSDYDRRKNEGAGAASDVWSLGCLLFELVAGHFLFFDPDWICFFMRITQQQEVRLVLLLWQYIMAAGACCGLVAGCAVEERCQGKLEHKLHWQSSQSLCPVHPWHRLSLRGISMLCRCCQRALLLLSNNMRCNLQVLLTEERLEPVRHIKGFLPLLEYILVRDQRRRPSIEDVIARCLRVPGC